MSKAKPTPFRAEHFNALPPVLDDKGFAHVAAEKANQLLAEWLSGPVFRNDRNAIDSSVWFPVAGPNDTHTAWLFDIQNLECKPQDTAEGLLRDLVSMKNGPIEMSMWINFMNRAKRLLGEAVGGDE